MINPVSGSMTSAMMPKATSGASMQKPMAQRMSDLFSKMDSGNSGAINAAQFQQGFARLNPPQNLKALGANAIFNQLDSQGSGSVSKQNFITGMATIISNARANSSAGASDADGDHDGSKGVNELEKARSSLNSGIGTSSTANSAGSLGTNVNFKV